MSLQMSALRPTRDEAVTDYSQRAGFEALELSPEEQAVRGIDAIWQMYAEEMERAVRKMSEHA